jgi:hypothetical protein
MMSKNDEAAEHQGMFEIRPLDVHDYVERHRPRVLRQSKLINTLGHPAINIGR